MVERVTGGKALPAEILRQIVGKTDGVPLFVEELTKMVLESGLLQEEDGRYVGAYGGAPIPPLAIPSTLQDSLMARLDRLSTVKEVAQLGATLGREFSYELLQAVAPVSEAGLQQALAKLVEAEILYQRGLPPQARYLFKHALIQDAAYQSLLKSRRQQYHRQIAQVLEERFSEIKETQPELLAHHFTEAGLTVQAIPYWQQAGQRAAQRSANMEAIGHLTKGLELLKTLPDTTERAQQELTLQLALGAPLIATKGYTAPEVEGVCVRARELCQQVGETSQLFQVLFGLFSFHIVRTECKTARELAEQLLSLAQRVQDPALLLPARQALGQCLYLLGELVPAREHLEQGIALYDRQQHHSIAFLNVADPGVICQIWGAFALWHLGYPDQALKRTHEAITLARELSHPYSLATALGRAAMLLHRLRQERQATQAQAEETISLATEHGFPFFSVQGSILRGWTLAEQGQTAAGIAQIHQGLAAFRDMGIESTRSYNLALLAEACGKAEQVEEGLSTLAEALAAVDKNGERFYEAELYRLKGQLTLEKEARGWRLETSSSSPQASSLKPPVSQVVAQEAEGYFLKAIEIARRQQAKSLELRATMSMARLWQQQGKREEARQMLAEIYGWFTEGFDTANLKEARALLESFL
jgi:predicted ATPase